MNFNFIRASSINVSQYNSQIDIYEMFGYYEAYNDLMQIQSGNRAEIPYGYKMTLKELLSDSYKTWDRGIIILK